MGSENRAKLGSATDSYALKTSESGEIVESGANMLPIAVMLNIIRALGRKNPSSTEKACFVDGH